MSASHTPGSQPSYQQLVKAGILAGLAIVSGAALAVTLMGAGDRASRSGTLAQRASRSGLVAEVTQVVDGDTIEVEVGGDRHTVRLLGIDTPEKPDGPRPAECFGQEAASATRTLLPQGTEVMLSRDVETRDHYGRVLAWVHRSDDGLFLNQHLVSHGYATPLFFEPNDRLEPEFVAIGHAARLNQLGLWAACGGPDVIIETDTP